PITVGHEYSVLVHLPNQDREQRWVIPLSIQRVPSDQKGPDIGLTQLSEAVNQTDLKNYFCVNVSDTAYSQKNWIIKINQWSHVVHLARMRGNRKLYRLPPPKSRTRCGRPRIYGEVFLLNNPSQPECEEWITTTSRKGKKWKVTLQRWNDLLAGGSKTEKTHEYPFDLVRVIVKDEQGKPVYRRPLWVMIAGLRRKEISSLQAYESYSRRYDIEHFFHFGKQKLGLVGSQTSETLHEENWHWIALLAYTMLFRGRGMARSIRYPWEKKKISVVGTIQGPTQVQRDYERIIREIGTPAPIPKPRGNPVGRKKGQLGKRRRACSLIQKSADEDQSAETNSAREKKKKLPRKKSSPYTRIKRIWTRKLTHSAA
ncbi:MAG: transposase, partial [Rhabdochlamydiaceae bacterium]